MNGTEWGFYQCTVHVLACSMHAHRFPLGLNLSTVVHHAIVLLELGSNFYHRRFFLSTHYICSSSVHSHRKATDLRAWSISPRLKFSPSQGGADELTAMKFGKFISKYSVPEWREKYLDYKV